jgi:hypothetical protein
MIEGDLSRLHEPIDGGNDLIALTLGMLALLDDFAEAVTESHEGMTESSGDDALLLAGLGLLSVRRTVRRWASHAASDHVPAMDRAAPTPLRQILR